MTTVRTIKLKRSSQAYGDSSGDGNLSSPAASEITSAPDMVAPAPAELTEPSASPAAPDGIAPKTVSAKSTVWFMLIAIFASIGLLIILGLQYSEMSFYKAIPSAWLPGK